MGDRTRRTIAGVAVALAAAAVALPSPALAANGSMPYTLQEFSTAFLSDADVKALADWGSVVTDTPAGQECGAMPSGGYDCGRIYPLGNTYSRPLRLEVKSLPNPNAAQAEFAQSLAKAKGSAYAVITESPTEFSIESHPDANHLLVTSGRIDRNHYIESVCASRILNGSRVSDVMTCSHMLLNAQQPRLAAFESPKVVPPAAPTGVLASVSGQSATVTWLAPESDGGGPITQYTVTSNRDTLTCTAAPTAELLQRCVVPGLRAGVDYSFTVTATNAKGTGPASAPSKSARFTAKPSAPREAKARLPGTTAVISWRVPSELGGLPIIRYVVTASPGSQTCITTARTCSISGLSYATKYRFAVQAINARGAGPTIRTPMIRTPAPPAPSTVPIPTGTTKPAPDVG